MAFPQRLLLALALAARCDAWLAAWSGRRHALKIKSGLAIAEAPAVALVEDRLVIGGRSFGSRLLTGTGKYRSVAEMAAAVDASGSEIVTVAVRRAPKDSAAIAMLGGALDWSKIWLLPNTAGCTTADDAVRVARLGRELARSLGQPDNNFVKLEVIADSKFLLPDPIGTLAAARQLVQEGFTVLPYCSPDPMLCRHLEDVGCAAVMPLGSPIGSGRGLDALKCLEIIIEMATVPVIVDAGLRTPSEAALCLEMGADAVLVNSAIAKASDPTLMARGFQRATLAGRDAYLAQPMPMSHNAVASSPLEGLPRRN